MSRKIKIYIINILIPLAVGGISAFLTMDAMKEFSSLNQPPLSPPPILFPIVWTILYTLMGIGAALVLTSPAPQSKGLAIRVYALQLFLNFLWPLLFFGAGAYTLAAIELLLLLFTVIVMTYLFSKSSKLAAYLQIPYILWLAFAAYLNIAVAILN